MRRRLEQVTGVASVVSRDAGREFGEVSETGSVAFEVHGLENYAIRPDLARAIVQSGWNLNELRAVGESLEEIFLELTRSEQTKEELVTQ